MYTGEPIALSDLNSNNYDIDHIYPQSKIKDDSLTNRVLVKRITNADKTNVYPIAYSVQSKMKAFWETLKNKGLINSEKYSRLTCTQELSYDVIGGFINRQLVSTNQAVKETANALGLLFGDDTKIIYSKARNVSEFRHNYDLIKCREVNNLHHAHDAYLNIVVGNVWDGVYGQYWKTNFVFNEDRAIDKLFQIDRDDIWQVSFIQKIKDYLLLGNGNKKYLDKFPVTTRPYEVKGAFYDQTIHPAGKGQFELKAGLSTEKYGGYKSGVIAYNCVIEYDGKGKNKGQRLRGVFSVPVRFANMNEDALLCQIADENKIIDRNPTLIIPKIMMFSVLDIDGIRYHMRSGDLQCSVTTEWYPDKEIIQIVRNIFKYQGLVKNRQITADKTTSDNIVFATRERNKNNKESKAITRESNLMLYDAIIEQVKKPFYANYSFAKKVVEGRISRDKFKELTTFEQIEQLVQLLNVITMNAQEVTSVQIGGGKSEKTKYIVTGISTKNIYLITQSVTGLFESRIAINTTNAEG
jgi:CRISPR-associated endonuclease Csn1